MFRRSRFSIRPNVGTTGRTAATPQEAPSANQEASETLKDVSESSTATAVTDNKTVVTPSEKPTAPGDGNDQNGEGTSSSAAVQRRKRFSIKPKVAPGRPSTLTRTPKSPVKAVSETPVQVPGSDLDKPTVLGQTATTTTPQGLQSPRRRRLSEDSKQPRVQPKPTLIPSDSPGPSAVLPAEDLLEQTHVPTDSSTQLESTSGEQDKEVPSKLSDKVPPSLPDKEAIEISEKAKTLVSSKSGLSLSEPAFSLSRLLNDPSDLQRLAKARKLRELLRQEMHKEKKIKKAKARVKEYTLDPAKMTMRDLIRYLPLSNPMTSSLEDPAPENETVVPPSPEREESPERAQEPEAPPNIAREEEEEEAAEEEQEEALMVPQVKVAEDGSLIIDEESLTVEVQRAKGPNPAQDRDPIFERGSTTTYSSFRKATYSKPWSSEETDMFFLAISMVGTDFSMICQLFPHRARSEIKNKFKKEERENAWRIDKAFRERRKLDIEYFSKLLEKILEVQKTRKKLKSLTEKNSSKKRKRKSKGRKAARKMSDVEEEDEEEENDIPDLEEEEGEKENEDLCNEGGTPVSKPKEKRKRKNKQDGSTEEPNGKKNKTGEKSNEQDEAYIPEDAEAALPEDRTNSDMPEKTEDANAAKDSAVKPAKLSRGRAPKPLLPLGRKWGKKPPPPSTKANDAVSDKGNESVDKDASPVRQTNERKSANDDVSSEEEDATVQPPRPTRYGRVPKPTKPLTYPAKDNSQSSASETTPASPAGSSASAAKPKPKSTAKRGRSSKPQSAQESKKPKLVTLRASQSEYGDKENEEQEEEEEEEEEEQQLACSKDSTAPAFVPASLRSSHPVTSSEVEESIEELDIIANMPDVLGISQDALCPDASCELAQNKTGTAESCEHQLDLLVDVIDFLSSEHTEVSADTSYNEAAQTLLTIGNLTHLSQSAQNQTAIQEHTTGTTSVSVDETSQYLEIETVLKPAEQEENSATLMSATSDQGVTEPSETFATVEVQNSTTENNDMSIIETSDQRAGSDMDPTPQLQPSAESSKKHSPQTKKGCLSKVKPKPNLGQASRTTKSKSQSEVSTVKTAEESFTVASDLSETVGEDTPKIADCSEKLSKAEMSCIEVKLTEEPSVIQERSAGQVKSGAATSDQSASEIQGHRDSDTKFDPSLEQATTDEKLMSRDGTTKNSCKNLVTSGTAVTESQIGRGANIDTTPVQQSSNHPAQCVTPVEDLPVGQKEESDASTRQARKSRFQKVKPKPNLAQTSRTVHSKPQATKGTDEKESDPTPNTKSYEKTIVEVEAEPTCTTPPEKPSQSSCPGSDFNTSLYLVSTRSLTGEQSEEKKTDVGVVDQVEKSAATSDQSASVKQNFTEAQFEPGREQTTGDTRPRSESTHEKLMSHGEIDESSCSNLQTSDSSVPESQIGQGSNIDSAPIQESSDHLAPRVTHVEELPVSQKKGHEDASSRQTRRSRFQKIKPNLSQISRTVRFQPQTTKDPVTHMPLAEKPSGPSSRPESTDNTIAEIEAQPTRSTTPPGKPSQIKSTDTTSVPAPSLELCSIHKPKEELSSTEGHKTDVGSALDSSSEGPEHNVPQRRRRLPKVKPNLGSPTRTTLTKLQANISKPSEQRHMDTSSDVTSKQQPVDDNNAQTELKVAEKDSKPLTSAHCSLHTELLSSAKLGPVETEESLDGTKDKGTSSDGIVIATSSVPENQPVLTDSFLENKSSEKPTAEGDKVETGPASQWDCKQDTSIRNTETNIRPTGGPSAISNVQSSDGSTESKTKPILPTNTQSMPDPKESTQQPRSENTSEAQSREAVQQCSETTEANQTAAQGTDESEPTNTSKTSRKAPQTYRGRLVKPKPNLGRSSQPPQAQQVRNTKQTEADSGTRSESMDALVSHKPVSELQLDIQELAKGATEQCSNQKSPPNEAGSSQGCLTQVIEQVSQHDSPKNVAGSSLGCLTQAPDISTQSQDSSTSSAGGTQSHPSLTIFPDLLSEQVPSDPDEPFFILSLTEIPVCPSAETVDGVSEPLPYLPATEASVQPQSSVPGDSLAAAGDGPLSNAAVPASTEESDETGLVSVKEHGPDPAVDIGSIMQNPVDPHGSTAVQLSVENDETECPNTKQAAGRTDKLQVKAKAPRKKQTSKTIAAKEADSASTQDSELPGPSVQPKAFDEVSTEPQKGSGDPGETQKETLTGGKDPADSSSGAQTTQTRGTKSRTRKPKGFPSFLSETNFTAPSSDSLPGKAASKGPKVKTPQAAGKQSTTAPVSLASHDVTPVRSLTQPSEGTRSMPSTKSPQAEVDMRQTSERSGLCSDPTPSTSLCTAEVSASQQSDGVESISIEAEPTTVSQYFLSDIFTEVQEGSEP